MVQDDWRPGQELGRGSREEWLDMADVQKAEARRRRSLAVWVREGLVKEETKVRLLSNKEGDYYD